MELKDLMVERFSVRAYRPDAVSDAQMTAILEASRCAPTAKNLQPQHIYAVRDKGVLEKLNAVTPCAYHAPLVFVITAKEKDAWQNPYTAQSSASIDTAIITTHMMLRARELGLGSCYVCWFDPKAVAKAIGIAEDETVYALLPVGLPDASAAPSPNHTDRKPLSDTVTVLYA